MPRARPGLTGRFEPPGAVAGRRSLAQTLGLLLVVGALPALSQDSPPPISRLPEDHLPSAQDPLADEVRHVDPGIDGWETEELSQAAAEQLKALSKLTTQGSAPAADELAPFLDQGFWTEGLRPRVLRPVADRPEVEVSRGEPSRQRLAGAEGLAEALARLVEPLGGRSARAKMKVISIEPGSDGGFTTEVLAHFQSTGDGAVFQSDGTWTVAWSRPEGAPPRLTGISVSAYTESRAPRRWFSDVTASALGAAPAYREQLLHGADEWCARIDFAARMNQYGHNGLAVADVDSDGLDDVYILQSGGLPNRLFRQRPDGTAEDISAAAGVDWLNESRAALFADFDNDGDQDLAVTTLRGLLILEGDGAGRFELAGVQASRDGYSLAAADYDADGRLDLYVTSYVQSASGEALPAPYHDANNGRPNYLYRNLGDLRFEDVTAEVGLDQNNRRFSFAAAWADYDGDGDPDLYVANDFGRNNLYRNTNGRFEDVAGEAGVEDMAAGMGVSWGDYDGNGELDLYVSNMFSSAGRRITYQRRFEPVADLDTKRAFQRHARGNSLFANQGDGTFRDVTVEAGVWMGRWAWGAQFVDLDNDGLEDIFVPNGFFTNELTDDL